MLIRFLVLIVLFSACRANEMACPKPKLVKLSKRPMNYQMRLHDRSFTASSKNDGHFSRAEIKPRQRPVKSVDSIEEWECPKPGAKTALPKAVKENIKKNRKKFETYYKNRNYPDSVQIAAPSNIP